MNTVLRTTAITRNLRDVRKQKGFTLSYVSKQTGIPRGTIGCYESYGNVGLERLKTLCDFYGVDVDWITDKH